MHTTYPEEITRLSFKVDVLESRIRHTKVGYTSKVPAMREELAILKKQLKKLMHEHLKTSMEG